MNKTKARCGHYVTAVVRGSIARQACEFRTCGSARCVSGLPEKFTDEECEAYVALKDMGVRFLVNMADKSVRTVLRGEVLTFDSLPALLWAKNQGGIR